MLLFDANLFFFMTGQEFLLLGKFIKAPSIETLLIAGSPGFKYAKQHLNSILDIKKKQRKTRSIRI
ncbi:MAG: hypothetical protein ACQEQW_04090 [Bacteroidota bacterium]